MAKSTTQHIPCNENDGIGHTHLKKLIVRFVKFSNSRVSSKTIMHIEYTIL